MNTKFEEFRKKKPQIVFEWQDPETDAIGWVVINSLRGGAAGGGTRMRVGLDKSEVAALAKTMEIKFSVSGPPIGGAKSGINFDPKDPRARDVLKRWYRDVIPLLKQYYGTGGDLNVDEVKDVIPITSEYGLLHPQEGVVNGHMHPEGLEKGMLIQQLRTGVSKRLENIKYTPNPDEEWLVADMITGYGVAEAVKHYYDIYKSDILDGKRAIIQGWGNVAAAAAFFLAQSGVKIVGIIDRESGIIAEEGLSYDRVVELFRNRDGNKLEDPEMISFEDVDKKVWDLDAEIFIPGAASRLLNREQVDRLLAGGCEVMSCGANVPFVDDDMFFGPTAEYTDGKMALIPDFIANCGMARVFAYLMQRDIELTDHAIFSDVSETISRALKETKTVGNGNMKLSQTSLQLALDKIF